MLISHGLKNIDRSELKGCSLTIGNFDGVHRAHAKLLQTTCRLATACGGKPVVLTFEPHPLMVLRPESAPQRLTHPANKLALLEASGISIAVVAESTPTLFELSPEDFVEKVILEGFRPRHIVEGPSFGFGKNRAGTPQVLRKLLASSGCEVHILDPVHLTLSGIEEVMVSSSLIRNLLTQGRVHDAATCLGRDYSLTATVVRGDGRGRRIGFPTANLAETEQLTPAEGVYAGRALIGSEQHACAISVGSSPTFNGAKSRVEAHLLDFDRDIYDNQLTVCFQRFLRPQQKYSSADALVDQLRRDVQATRNISREASSLPEAGPGNLKEQDA